MQKAFLAKVLSKNERIITIGKGDKFECKNIYYRVCHEFTKKWVISNTGILTLKNLTPKFYYRHQFKFENGKFEFSFELDNTHRISH